MTFLLAALDHNFHVFRKTLEGRFKKIYSKRSGYWRVEPVKESKQYPHMSLLQATSYDAAVKTQKLLPDTLKFPPQILSIWLQQ